MPGYLDDLNLARTDYENEYVSAFWNIFSPEFCALLADPEVWNVYRRNGLTFGLETGLPMANRRLASQGGTVVPEIYSKETDRADAVNRYDRLVAMAGEDFVNEAIECEAGSPSHLPHKGLRLNFDDLYQIYHVWQIWRLYQRIGETPEIIVEIGGGYGSLANKLRKLFPASRYIILDLPEVLAIQYNHLSICRPEDKIGGLGDFMRSPQTGSRTTDWFDIGLLPGWRTDLIEGLNLDLVINMRSMMEMRRPVIAEYFRFIERSLSPGGFFYCVNRYEKIIDGDPVRIKDFPFDDNWSSILSQPTWLQTHIHELLARRESEPPLLPLNFLLESFPDVSPAQAP